MKFKNFILQAWRVIEFNGRSWKIKVLCGRLPTYRDTLDDKSKGNVPQRGVIKQRELHAFLWTPEFCVFRIVND